ncbi:MULTISPECIES: LAETG motif-containing sortase-dependent surface protein [Streptomyces]|uniref:LAETG motif-containing sortase-dependent surface protein n=1 Tax=Streptomyces TaxID=1883 RepID=UPI001E3FD95B|nr:MULTISPECIES: LAETG motif-containing sortase-dependent surface protein [Streptomyces]
MTPLSFIFFFDQKRSTLKIRRILATAVAAAVTTPVVFLSAAPAFADTKPTAPAQTQDQKPTIEQLKAAVTAAQTAYDIAVIAESDARKAIEALIDPENGLQIHVRETRELAAKAAEDKVKADEKVTTAQAKLDAATDEAAKAEAQKELDEAKTAAETAAAAKTAADTKVTAAVKALEDAKVAAFTTLATATSTKEVALKTLKAAEKALADALAEEGEEPGEEEPPHEDCFPESRFTTVVHGLPEKVVAGTTVDFTLRVTNGTDKKMDEVYPYAAVHAFDAKGIKELDTYLDLEWATAGNAKWQDVDPGESLFIGAVGAKSSVDVKLRLKVDADTPAGQGAAFVAGDFWNEDESCGGTPDVEIYDFSILAKGTEPGKVDDATAKPGNTGTTQQGGSSNTPVTNNGTTGSLAETGSDSAVPQIAMAGGAAVVLGAGAMFFVRRRNAGVDA